MQQLFDKAGDRLAELTSDQSKYQELLQGLILQGLLQLMEEKVTVTCKSTDVQLTQAAAKEAEKQYKEKSGRTTTVTVQEGLDKQRYVADCASGPKRTDTLASHGGLILSGHGGRININQTLDERLRLLEEHMLPEIRK